MKREKLIKHLVKNGCVLAREGKKHSIYENAQGIATTVPRHPDIRDDLAKTICKQLKISAIGHN